MEWPFSWPRYLNIWIPAVVSWAILVTVAPLFSALYSGGVPVSRSRHATIAWSYAAERRGRDVGVPSTRRCSLPERYCALHQTRCPLIRVRRGHVRRIWKLMNTFIQAQYSSQYSSTVLVQYWKFRGKVLVPISSILTCCYVKVPLHYVLETNIVLILVQISIIGNNL